MFAWVLGIAALLALLSLQLRGAHAQTPSATPAPSERPRVVASASASDASPPSEAPSALPAASAAASAAPSVEPAPPKPSTGPVKVTVGLYVNQVYELSLKDNRVVLDFWLWFRWKGDELKPYETFEVKNARLDSKGEPTIKQVNGENYAYLRVVANLTHFWNVSAYPFDEHTVKLEIEEVDSEQEHVVFVPDVESSGLSRDVQVLTFVPSAAPAVAGTSTYHSNFGDPSLEATNQTVYSKVSMPLFFKREGLSYFIKLFFGLFVAAGIAFLAFFIKPTDLDPRFGLGVGAIFAAIASEYVVAGALPDSASITLADKLHIVAFGAIFLSIVQSTLSLHLFTNGDEERSKRLDKLSAIAVPLGYIALSFGIVLFR